MESLYTFFQTSLPIDISLDSSKQLEYTMQFLKYFLLHY